MRDQGGRRGRRRLPGKRSSGDEETDDDPDDELDNEHGDQGLVSGAEIKNLCTEAGMLAIRDNRDKVTEQDFIAAKEKVMEAGRNKGNPVPAYMFQ